MKTIHEEEEFSIYPFKNEPFLSQKLSKDIIFANKEIIRYKVEKSTILRQIRDWAVCMA